MAGAIGCLLCLTAALKLVDLFVSSAEGSGLILPLVGSSVEALVGVALIFRIQPAVSIPAAGLLFVVLAGASLIGTGRGVARCGCLGMVPMPPWILLVCDVGAAGVLLRGPLTSRRDRPGPKRALLAACIGAMFTGLAVGSILYPRPGAMVPATSAEAVAAARTVVIEPAELRGRPFFLLPSIRIDADLSVGEWKVILARAGCRMCERRLRSGGCDPDGQERVAVVLAAEREGWVLPEGCRAAVGHLSPDKTWLFDGPLILRLVDGRIVEAH